MGASLACLGFRVWGVKVRVWGLGEFGGSHKLEQVLIIDLSRLCMGFGFAAVLEEALYQGLTGLQISGV